MGIKVWVNTWNYWRSNWHTFRSCLNWLFWAIGEKHVLIGTRPIYGYTKPENEAGYWTKLANFVNAKLVFILYDCVGHLAGFISNIFIIERLPE